MLNNFVYNNGVHALFLRDVFVIKLGNGWFINYGLFLSFFLIWLMIWLDSVLSSEGRFRRWLKKQKDKK